MIKCLICEQPFDNEKSFHLHLKKHKTFQSEYYCKFFPRKSLHWGDPIPFKDRTQYFETEFINKKEIVEWCNNNNPSIVKSKMLDMLKKRIDEKEYKFAPFFNEIETLLLPPVEAYRKHFGSYLAACQMISVEPLFKKPMPKCFYDKLEDFEIIIDSREQSPLDFKNFKVEKIYVGDYIYTGNNYSYTFVDRKSWSDFIGTLSSGLERFEREIQKAIDLSGYLFVVVESTVDEIKQNHGRFRCLNSLEYIFHNMRHLTHKYNGKIQFIFSGNRENSKKIIPKLLYHGKKLWETDVQFFLNFKKLL